MRRLAPLILAACALMAPRAALAAPPDVRGITCGYISLTDPTADPDTQTLELDGGPLVVTGADGLPISASLTCTIQVNAYTHDAPDAAAVTSVSAPVAVLAPAAVTYSARPYDNVVLCTRLDLANGTALYYTAGTEVWSTDPTAYCADPDACLDCPAPDPIDYTWIDAVVCPVLATQAPPEGDVHGVWDCPPYGS